MNESVKTIIFVVVSGVLASLALVNFYGSAPTSKGDFELVGKPFFEDFQSTAEAKSLEVIALDTASMARQTFIVQNDKGTWKIPSHHHYPAEAAARLAETATSVMGITRLSFEGSISEHERLGVVDPQELDEEKIDDPTSVGKRITLRDGDGEPLVDLIIGKPAGDVSRADLDPTISAGELPATYFYVRRADEQQVYKSLININLSTRFSDWIDPDLLRVNSGKIMRLDIDNYELSEQREGFLGQIKSLFKTQGDRVVLSRGSFADAWDLVGLNPEKEELNSTRIQSSLEILSELVIAGVRPKFKFKGQLLLTPDLKFNQTPEMEENIREAQAAVEEFQEELEDRGFSLAGTQDQLEIASANGHVQVGTDEGVLYTLQIGKTVEGTEKEIEIGGAKTVDDVDTEDEQQKIANYLEGEKNRYVMISVNFDETLLGQRPVKPTPPVEPTKPDGYMPVDEKNESADENNRPAEEPTEVELKEPTTTSDPGSEQTDGQQPATAAEESTNQEPESADQQPQPIRDPAFVLYEDALANYEQDKIDYELALTRFEEEHELFEEKVTEGKTLVNELNQRFGDWYYVIKGSNLRALQLKRADVVQPRADLQQPDQPHNDLPPFPNLDYPEVEKSNEPASETVTKPTTEAEKPADPPAADEPDTPTNTSTYASW